MMPIKDINDYENTLTGQYIRAIENPDSIGYRDGKWYESNLRGYDLRNRGFGVDVKNNDAASKIVNGRDGKWLTEAEERNLRNRHIDYISGVLLKWATDKKRLNPNASEVKKAMVLGMLYRGDGIGAILNNSKLLDAYNNGTDRNFENAVFDFYGDSTYNDVNGKKHYNPERARMHKEFVDNYLQRQEEKRLQELQEQQLLQKPKLSEPVNNQYTAQPDAVRSYRQQVVLPASATTVDLSKYLKGYDKGGTLSDYLSYLRKHRIRIQ